MCRLGLKENSNPVFSTLEQSYTVDLAPDATPRFFRLAPPATTRVLDLMRPITDGFAVSRTIRRPGCDVPVEW